MGRGLGRRPCDGPSLLTLQVVGGTPGRIAKDLPRSVDRDHPLGGVGCGREVRVKLLGEPAVGGLDHLWVGLGVDLEELVQVQLIGHGQAVRV